MGKCSEFNRCTAETEKVLLRVKKAGEMFYPLYSLAFFSLIHTFDATLLAVDILLQQLL